MAYMHGNLAMQPKKQPEHRPSVQERKRVVVRKKTLPVQEKLLYLFTIFMCVVVAGVIIFRYAQIYQLNVEIKELTRDQSALMLEIRELQKQVETLSDPGTIIEKAKQSGMVKSEEPVIAVEIGDRNSQTAMRE
ncbi:cell division initiation protein [Paenibacillus sambharensis]|uniref:Cell division protein FtsL n=1 Tax=Paenibacillus sambharensis TaxID=1803190 RepID=A0A2W1L3G6_9BACL|nr:FtsL-like putative cell division protein [Paenibacillus sambharensis]PZD93896.1 cell division initiation protein [Paenibacillus sambharensis]